VTVKVIILAGGLGTRISEETENKPKPMVLIDDKPILWHLMNIFSQQGYCDFVLALGYRSDVIKGWLLDLSNSGEEIEIDSISKKNTYQVKSTKNTWNVTALETGLNTQTGGRISRCMKAFPGERMIATYGDGLANISIKNLLNFHVSHGKLATVTAVRPPARFGHMQIEGDQVVHFGEKNQSDEGWINGGFFVLEPEVGELVENDTEPFEIGVLPKIATQGQLMAFHHRGFWHPMDTLRDKNEMSAMASRTPPPWMAPE
jgi:glucose-1-phosphate cytidylyltransferase